MTRSASALALSMDRKAHERGFKAWAIQWESNSRLSGHCVHFIGGARMNRPVELSGCNRLLFARREDARAYIKKEYGYIATRADLRTEPHGWKVPKVVRVIVQVRPCAA